MALVQGKGPGKESPAIYLAAFGKHPGWDDHIEDIGIETELLAQARRMLYTDAISGNIDSGAWEKLADDQKLPGFAHDFIWWMGPSGKEPPRVLVGRFWSSRDGKGRSKYPMAVYVQANNIPLTLAAREILPVLASLEKACIEASSAQDVKAAIDRTREQLRAQFARPDASIKVPSPAEIIPAPRIAELLDREPLGPRKGEIREGFARAMYAVEREMGAFLPIGGDGRKSKTLGVQPPAAKAAHIRLPALEHNSSDAALAWISILSRRLAEGTPILAVIPRGEGFIDVVVGEPGAAQLYCIRASAKGFPLTTDVPYVIDDAFMSRLGEMVARWTGAAPATGERPAVVNVDAKAEAGSAIQKKSGLRGWLFGGGAAIVLVGVGIAVMNSAGPGDPAKQPLAAATGTGGTTPSTAPSTDTGPPQGEPGVDAGKAEEAKKAEEARQADEARRLAAQEAEKQRAAEEERQRLAAMEAKRVADEKAEKQRQDEKARADAASARKAEQEAADREAREKASRELAQREADEKARLAEAARLAEDQKKAREAADAAAAIEAQQRAAEEAKKLADAKAAEEKAAEESARQAKELTAQLEVASTMIAQGATLADAAEDGRSLAKLVEDVRAHPAFAAVAQSETARYVILRSSLLSQISSSTDAAFLTKQASDVSGENFGVAVAAMERLAGLGWPRENADFERALADLQSAQRAADGVKDAVRAERAHQRLAQVGRSMWLSAWKSVGSNDLPRQNSMLAAMPRCGVEASTLDPAERYNVELAGLKARAQSIPASEIDVQVARFVESAPQAARASLEPLVAMLNQRRDAAASGPPLEKLGPGSLEAGKAWKLAGAQDGWLVFEPPAGSKIKTPLVFGRVSSAGGDAYVLISEVSIGLFAATVDQAGAWSDIVKLGRIEAKAQLRRDGPAGWEWEMGGTQVVGMRPAGLQNRTTSRGWFDFDTYMAKTPYFEQGKEPEAPSVQTPMQYVSPAAAIHVARLLGCRLPTSGEFASIIQASESSSANRRDASWLAANATLYKKSGGRNTTALDGEIFLPPSVTVPTRAKAAAASAADDGTILFRQVSPGTTGTSWQDAVGNVSEFVLDTASVWGTAPSTVAELRDWTSKSDALRVMGGSALSPAEVDPATPYAVKGVSSLLGYSDVGFRVAFDAQGAGQMTADGAGLASLVAGLRFQGRND